MDIQSTRIQVLNGSDVREDGAYVLYWMQNAQRAAFNPALEIAIEAANERDLPALVCFGLDAAYPEANIRHYAFMLEGLADVARALAARGVGFVVKRGAPPDVALHYARRAALVIVDRGYLAGQRAWRAKLAAAIDRRLVQVEGDVVAPIEAVSSKHEFAARTLRPRLHRVWDDYATPLTPRALRRVARHPDETGDVDITRPDDVLSSLPVGRDVPAVRRFRGGYTQARARLDAFLQGPLARYSADRNRPEAGAASHMSPYLHFGQISPVEILLAVRAARAGGAEDKASYLEELVLRRELAINHCYYEPAYASYDGLPRWSQETLGAHASDPRPHAYSRADLEAGRTHDRFWNAAMTEMRATGYMHNQLRMYWGKKIIEWSPSPRDAFETALHINNKYFLDGRDANSFANIGWLFGLHDRPWTRRPIFGTVRYLNANSLKKFNARLYLIAVERLAADEAP